MIRPLVTLNSTSCSIAGVLTFVSGPNVSLAPSPLPRARKRASRVRGGARSGRVDQLAARIGNRTFRLFSGYRFGDGEDVRRIAFRWMYLAGENRRHQLVIASAIRYAAGLERHLGRQRLVLKRLDELDRFQALGLLCGDLVGVDTDITKPVSRRAIRLAGRCLHRRREIGDMRYARLV